jgi:hypothetical protein
MIRLARTLSLLGVLAFCIGATGCVAVKPWEKDLLAKPGMAWSDDARLATMQAHIGFSKEASLPAGGGAAGGCGCN